jgi:superfamily I DNA and RNA helicase
MLTFLPAVPEYATDEVSKLVWDWISAEFGMLDGIGYYKYPVVRASSGVIPELTLITRTHQPIAVRCLSLTLDEIQNIEDDTWKIQGEMVDSPFLELDDFVTGIQSSLDKERMLRKRFSPIAVLALPLISKIEFEKKFGKNDQAIIIFTREDIPSLQVQLEKQLNDLEWRLMRAVIQGIRPLNLQSIKKIDKAVTLGDAFIELEKQIALLDFEQEKVAIPIAPGPQRIRGLAGTGKTVLLAMKAANIHKHYPDKKILFTFNTQSLYGQAKNLISKFYRYHTDVDPDWDKINIRHGWGGQNRPGVYFDVATRQGTMPMNYSVAKSINQKSPFRAACQKALSLPIEPEYDFILVDEAQDFPAEFFQVLFKLTKGPNHCIYWAYDELQSLFSLEIPKAEDLFGKDEKGKPLVTLEGDDYPGGIEKDLVLHQSYRCPHQILMLAHAIGLGLYNETGPVQMLQNSDSWKAIGYEVTGELKKDEQVTIFRAPENSPNKILDIYQGSLPLIVVTTFLDRNDELEWIANSIQNDIFVENVIPEQIVVISLDAIESKSYMSILQQKLLSKGVGSTIPGVVDDSSVFAEPGKVTLSTVYRAKGNEAPIIYILSFESLFDYLAPVETRNKAFTSISRSKAFVRISGVGKNMDKAKNEIDRIINDYPYFRFVFPDMETIRNLDAETSKRRRIVAKAKDSLADLVKMDPQALAALAKSNPELIEQWIKLISGVTGEDQ